MQLAAAGAEISWFEDSPVLAAVHCSVGFTHMCMNVCVCVNVRTYMHMYIHTYVKEMYCFLALSNVTHST